MTTHLRYKTHLKPIKFDTDSNKSVAQVNTALLASIHEEFIYSQGRSYQAFLQFQQNLLEQWNARPQLPQVKFSREDLEILASEEISPFFGSWFEPLDKYAKLIRMPMPPLLLADRVTHIQGMPGSMQKGSIWTETDVKEDSWYINDGHMPTGIMLESGQADLLLISWLGADLYNQGERVYRLLGCEATFYGSLPVPGDTLCFDIHVDGHAKQGDVRIFFFHYDCRINGKLILSVRRGQAGFFTEEELANSGGVLWSPEDKKSDLPHSLPILSCKAQTFSKEQLIAFSQGNTFEYFGEGFEMTNAHTRTPKINSDKLLFIDEITLFDPFGGPKKRGIMRAIQNIDNNWFFDGHFKNDPCMPGTLMLEAGLQVMACYLTALGATLDKDGWRFEPVTNITSKLNCRGQVTPKSSQVVYEIFVENFSANPIPTLIADLLVSVDGLKAFHTQIGLKLTPDVILSQITSDEKSVDGFKFDYASLLACALGKPSDAFGSLYKPFDRYCKIARVPAPPFLFMSEISKIDATLGLFKEGQSVSVEFNLSYEDWFFHQNTFAAMPLSVLMEVGLQPCGWLAFFMGAAFQFDEDLLFRNLDGKMEIFSHVLPTNKQIHTKATCIALSKSAGMLIESFKVESFVDDTPLFTIQTTFGHFPKQAFINQAGLSVPESELNFIHAPSEFFVDLRKENILLAKDKLLMIDKITGFWQNAGTEKRDIIRAEKTINSKEWFFKAHFFQDPVQPGSLGIEAMIQLLQFYMIHEYKLSPDHEFQLQNTPFTWKYRGQVTPINKTATLLMEIQEKGTNKQGTYCRANCSLWIDNMRIYECHDLSLSFIHNVNEEL
ncbi:MAG: hypothetical protein P4L16_05855 [Chlamydiales bacterium]|nr:hypothetical protein [Chlamydiales bacterium]